MDRTDLWQHGNRGTKLLEADFEDINAMLLGYERRERNRSEKIADHACQKYLPD